MVKELTHYDKMDLLTEYKNADSEETINRLQNIAATNGLRIAWSIEQGHYFEMLPKEPEKPSLRYNVIFMCVQDWEGTKEKEVGRYESNHPFPDLSQSDSVKIEGKNYFVVKRKVEFDPGESLVVIYEVFCKDVPEAERDDEE